MLWKSTKWTRWAVRLLIVYLLLQLLWPLFFEDIIWPSWTGFLKLGVLVVLTTLTAYHLTITLLIQWSELRAQPQPAKPGIWSRLARACAPC